MIPNRYLLTMYRNGVEVSQVYCDTMNYAREYAHMAANLFNEDVVISDRLDPRRKPIFRTRKVNGSYEHFH